MLLLNPKQIIIIGDVKYVPDYYLEKIDKTQTFIRINNKDWVEVEAGDFMWLRAFCPQGCYAGGHGRFRYLLYKDVNRHPKLKLFGSR